MPKKFRSVNTKAEAARERKATAKEAAEEKKRKEEEDSYWRDDDKHVTRKQDRKVCVLVYILTQMDKCKELPVYSGHIHPPPAKAGALCTPSI